MRINEFEKLKNKNNGFNAEIKYNKCNNDLTKIFSLCLKER